MRRAALIEKINKLPDDRPEEVEQLVQELLHREFLRQYNPEIDDAVAQIEAGQLLAHNEVKHELVRMVSKNVWDTDAEQEFKRFVLHVKAESPQNAGVIRKTVNQAIRKLKV